MLLLFVEKAIMIGLFYIFGISILICHTAEGSWGDPSSSQYHIQTDEGPERYFRYQTDSGQFRKEKRLADGTVVGTDAWIDAFGYLRQKDYIADREGYRILKSKTVFVGRDLPIQEAMKAAKKSPAQAGILVKDPPVKGLYDTPVTSTTIRPPNSIGYDYKSPNVYIRPHSDPIDYLPPSYQKPVHKPHEDYLPATTSRPLLDPIGSTLAPPYRDEELIHKPIAVFNPSSTARPHPSKDYGPPIAVYSTTQKPDLNSIISSTSYSPIDNNYISSTEPTFLPTVRHEVYQPISNGLEPPKRDFVDIRPTHKTYVESSTARPLFSDNAVPLFDRSKLGERRRPIAVGDGYNEQFPLYDGIAVTKDGFRYYLPRQYHEEENSSSDSRTGSFGYIDPFGIRRVVYYNTGPGKGFVHRKNNRYVGFNATPYDPRPIS